MSTIKRSAKPPAKLSANVPLKVAALLWLMLSLFALTRLSGFEEAAGVSGHAPPQWQKAAGQKSSQKSGPGSDAVVLDPIKPTLVMLLHPRCPCSQASISELNHLMAICPNRAAVSVLFLRPAGYSRAWVNTTLWRQASAIPGVRVRTDDDGNAARRFGAATSGETLLYAPNGRLLYQGGLTGERGHEGDNAGLSAVISLLLENPKMSKGTTTEQEPVYGCPLTASRAETQDGKVLSGSRVKGARCLP